MALRFTCSNGEVAAELEAAFDRLASGALTEAARVLSLLLEEGTFELPGDDVSRTYTLEQVGRCASLADAVLMPKDAGEPFRKLAEVTAGMAGQSETLADAGVRVARARARGPSGITIRPMSSERGEAATPALSSEWWLARRELVVILSSSEPCGAV